MISAILLSVLCLTACESTSLFDPYATDIDKFYDVIYPRYKIPEECILKEDENPEIFSSSDISADIYYLRSIYYYPIGVASWNGTAESVNDIRKNAEKLCRKYGATVALYDYEYTGTRNGWTQYGSYSIDRYDCDVWLFVSYEESYILQPKIGIEWRDLEPAERIAAKRNTGAYIGLIYHGSPAFYANLAKGDIIIAIDDTPIYNADSIHQVFKNLNVGDWITITYIRDGKEYTTDCMFY